MNDTAKQQVIPITEHRGGTMPIPQPPSETAAMVHMIERMARDAVREGLIDVVAPLAELPEKIERALRAVPARTEGKK